MKKKTIIFSFIIGIILLVIGFYYSIIKAGIPYQDSTPEMIQMYNKNMKIGDGLTLIGFCIELFNIIVVIINFILRKLKSKRKIK